MVTVVQKAIESKFMYKYQSENLLVNIQNSFQIVPSVQLASNNAKAIEEWSVDYVLGS